MDEVKINVVESALGQALFDGFFGGIVSAVGLELCGVEDILARDRRVRAREIALDGVADCSFVVVLGQLKSDEECPLRSGYCAARWWHSPTLHCMRRKSVKAE